MKPKEDELEKSPNGKKRILLVDDDWLVGSVAEEILGKLGYRVKFEMNPETALNHFREDAHGFDLIMTDMHMPEMSGTQLAHEIMKIREDIPVVMCTGDCSVRFSEAEAVQMGLKALLMKPVEMHELKRTIYGVMQTVTESDHGPSGSGQWAAP